MILPYVSHPLALLSSVERVRKLTRQAQCSESPISTLPLRCESKQDAPQVDIAIRRPERQFKRSNIDGEKGAFTPDNCHPSRPGTHCSFRRQQEHQLGQVSELTTHLTCFGVQTTTAFKGCAGDRVMSRSQRATSNDSAIRRILSEPYAGCDPPISSAPLPFTELARMSVRAVAGGLRDLLLAPVSESLQAHAHPPRLSA